jgi:hypothetical protein
MDHYICQIPSATETIDSALHLEALAQEEGFKIKHYHSDNSVLSSSEFKTHCNTMHIKYSFSGVDAKHLDGIAEQRACVNMLHLAHN